MTTLVFPASFFFKQAHAETSQLLPCMVMVGPFPLLPESPRWLLNYDRVEDAQEALRHLLGKDLSADHPVVQNELKFILSAIEIERRSRISFKEVILCRDRSGHLKRLLLGCCGQFIQVCLSSKDTSHHSNPQMLSEIWTSNGVASTL